MDGTLTVRVIDVDAVSRVLVEVMPDAKDLITAFATGQPRVGDSKDEIEFELLISNGQIRLGLIPIAAIPPL